MRTEDPLSVQQKMDVPIHQFNHGSLKPIAQGILQTFLLLKMRSRKTIHAAEHLQSNYDMRGINPGEHKETMRLSVSLKSSKNCAVIVYILKRAVNIF